MDIKLPIGERLRAERDRIGMTQQEFADVAGVTRKTLFGYETGVRPPDAAALSAWAELGLDVLYVITGQRSTPVAVPPELNRREKALLDNYRHSGEDGERAVEATASALAEPRHKGARHG